MDKENIVCVYILYMEIISHVAHTTAMVNWGGDAALACGRWNVVASDGDSELPSQCCC